MQPSGERTKCLKTKSKSSCTQRSNLRKLWPGWLRTYTDDKREGLFDRLIQLRFHVNLVVSMAWTWNHSAKAGPTAFCVRARTSSPVPNLVGLCLKPPDYFHNSEVKSELCGLAYNGTTAGGISDHKVCKSLKAPFLWLVAKKRNTNTQTAQKANILLCIELKDTTTEKKIPKQSK